ncbi:hypothetical protein [Nonlabens ulvanivorans]|uniref:hypothetical protein n=1 Tax=Nonlabens ulvanivorans TaxID=906888 RepID=UPI0037CB69D3
MISISKFYVVIYIHAGGLSAYKFSLKKNELLFIGELQPIKKDSLFLTNNLLIINNTSVITKSVDSKTLEYAFEEAFPAFKKSDLYYDYQIGDNSKLSIITKEAFSKLTTQFDLKNLFTSKIRLGTSVNSFTDMDCNPIGLCEYALVSELKKINQENNLDKETASLKKIRFNKRFFEFTKWGAIAFFLIGLVFNFHFHEKYRNELNEANTLAKSYKGIDEKLEKLTIAVNSNNQLVNSNNRDDINRLRFLNEIILMAGSDISLSQFVYQPLRTKLNQDKEIRLLDNQVKISGNASSKAQLDTYMTDIKDSDSINQLKILNINQETKFIEFELLIELNDVR